jgi:predicted Zn finger-like uncharacterized protein
MRLVCPNCDAQYEVDDAAIPLAGRDVQCSNCGHAWFQPHPSVEAEMALEEEIFEPLDDLPEAPPPPGLRAATVAATAPAADDEEGEAADWAREAPVAPPDPVEVPPRRRVIDEQVLAVLREEAEREAAVRRTEAPAGVEMQPDLGLPPPVPQVPASVLAARERFRDLSADPDDEQDRFDDPPHRAASRRELLPDIEEINSTLRSSSEPRIEETDAELMEFPDTDTGRQGFRSGFVLMIVISVGLWMAYTMAPRIVQQMPATEGPMKSYVATVDSLRVGLDNALRKASAQLRSLSGEGG